MSTTSLSGQQVLQEVYIPADQALRVESVGTTPISGNVNIHDSSGNPLNSTSGSLNVDVTNFPSTQPVSASSLPLPTGASTSANQTTIIANQTNGTQVSRIEDSAGNPLTSTSGALNVNSSGTSTVSGTVNTNINGLTTFQTSQYTIGTSAVQLTPTPLTNRSSLSIKAHTTTINTIYIGSTSSVTTSTGYILFDGDSIQLDLTGTNQLWAIASAAGQILYVLEIAE